MAKTTKTTKVTVQLTAADRAAIVALLESVAGDVGGSYGKQLRAIRRRMG